MRHHLVTDADPLPRAAATASAAARHAGVMVRDLDTPAATARAAELFGVIWRASPDAEPVSADLMRALSRTGNYVAGAYSGDTLVGASVAFFTDEKPPALHSHISGVLAAMQGRSVGFALKLHQRAWALRRGIATITWTVDPLVRRNVYFNLAKLGAVVTDYVPDFYGRMRDGVNVNDASDRLLLTWSLTADAVAAASAGEPLAPLHHAEGALLTVGPSGEPTAGVAPSSRLPVLACEIPADITHIRETDPPLAHAWRHALRDALTTALSAGYHITGVTRQGCYLLTRS